jgi:hypothetical protein
MEKSLKARIKIRIIYGKAKQVLSFNMELDSLSGG